MATILNKWVSAALGSIPDWFKEINFSYFGTHCPIYDYKNKAIGITMLLTQKTTNKTSSKINMLQKLTMWPLGTIRFFSAKTHPLNSGFFCA